MVKIKREGIILEKTDHSFEDVAVLNPAVIKEGDNVHLFYRAVRKGEYSTIGYCRLDGPVTIAERLDFPLINAELEFEIQGLEDPRIVKIDDLYYLTYTAYDGFNARGALATSTDMKTFTKHGLIAPPIRHGEFMSGNKTGGRMSAKYYRNQLYYYRESEPGRALMIWDKNFVFFPRRIKGKLVFFHCIRPGIQIVAVNNLDE